MRNKTIKSTVLPLAEAKRSISNMVARSTFVKKTISCEGINNKTGCNVLCCTCIVMLRCGRVTAVVVGQQLVLHTVGVCICCLPGCKMLFHIIS
jgi:hypothetical protein